MSESERYRRMSARYLKQAQDELAIGDLPQASEKYWGAATQLVKAIAEDRGWRHQAHALLSEIVDDLADETRDPELSDLFYAAGRLHINFYEHRLSATRVAGGAERAAELMRRRRAIDRGPSP